MPVLTPAVAHAIRDRIPAPIFFEQFDRASGTKFARAEAPLRAFERDLLALLLRLRSERYRAALPRIAAELGATDQRVCRGVYRLAKHGLLPNYGIVRYLRRTGGRR